MNRRLLVLLVAGGTLGVAACGAAPAPSAAPTSTAPTPAEAESGGGGSSKTDPTTSDADLQTLQTEADRVLEELFVADRDLDYRTIETLTSRAVAARYRNQELLGSIERLDDSFKVPPSESVEVTSDLEVEEPKGDRVDTTGSVTVTYTGEDGEETTYTYDDIVFELDGDELLVADWRSDTSGMLASAAFLNAEPVDPVTAFDVTVTLEPGYRDPLGEPAFVEYLFTVDNGSDLETAVSEVELTTPDGERYPVQFGVADRAGPGDTVAARVGFEGPAVPVWGGTLTVTLEDGDGYQFSVDLEVPPFVDEDGEAEEPRAVRLEGGTTASGSSASELRPVTAAIDGRPVVVGRSDPS